MSKKILPYLISFCALGLGGTAAYYSIIGLSKLFSGVAIAVIVMASFLEISKLTLAAFIHSYWNYLKVVPKIYYTISLIILSLITSLGIYGMLSSGYSVIASQTQILEGEIQLITLKKNNLEQQLSTLIVEKNALGESINTLRSGLSNNIIQYKDKSTGQIITTTSSANRKAFENQLEVTIQKQNKIDEKIENLNNELFIYNTSIYEKEANLENSSELGSLKYIASILNRSLDEIVNWLILIIIFVFDPLAISLVIAAGYAFSVGSPDSKETIENIDEPKVNDILKSIPPSDFSLSSIPKEKRQDLLQTVKNLKDIKDDDLLIKY